MEEQTSNFGKKPKNKLPILTGVLVLAIFVLVGPVLIKDFVKFERSLPAALNYVSTASVTVGNVDPVATSATLVGNYNTNSEIVLTEGTTTPISVTGTVTDANGCLDLDHVNVAVYKNGTTCTSAGNDDNTNCYFETISHATIAADSSNCSGGTDTTYTLSGSNPAVSTFNIEYYAIPAAHTSAGTGWKVTIDPVDAAHSGNETANTSGGISLDATTALEVSSTIAYGNVANGSNSNATSPAPTAVVTNTGNDAIDYKLSGADLSCPTSGNSIPVGNEYYSQTGFTIPGGTALASSTPGALVAADIAAQTTGTPVTATSYWQVTVPYGVNGTCSGDVTFTAVAH